MRNIGIKYTVTLSAWVVLLIVAGTSVCNAEPDGGKLVIAAGGETKAVIVVSPSDVLMKTLKQEMPLCQIMQTNAGLGEPWLSCSGSETHGETTRSCRNVRATARLEKCAQENKKSGNSTTARRVRMDESVGESDRCCRRRPPSGR